MKLRAEGQDPPWAAAVVAAVVAFLALGYLDLLIAWSSYIAVTDRPRDPAAVGIGLALIIIQIIVGLATSRRYRKIGSGPSAILLSSSVRLAATAVGEAAVLAILAGPV